MAPPIAILTRSERPTEWELAVQTSLLDSGRHIVTWPAGKTAEAMRSQVPGVDLLIDLSENGAGFSLAGKLGIPIWLLCHGPDIRFDLCDSMKAGFVAREPFIELRLIEWRAETGSARPLCLHRLRRRKTPERSIAAVRSAARDWFTDALKGPRILSASGSREVRVTRGIAPAPWRLKAATLASLAGVAADLFTMEEWNVGTVPGGPEQVFKHGLIDRAKWLPSAGRFRFRSDPFGWRDEDGRTILLYEAFDYRDGKGRIVRNVDGQEEVIGDFPYHAAYPYLIESDGQRHAIPELSEMACPAAYPVTRTSPKWTLEGIPLKGLEDVPLSDGTVFHHGDRFWLFGMRSNQESGTVLHAWHAPARLGPWTPHERNPIKIDITSSRPGGTPFMWQGDLIRPAQDCSTTYGAAIVLNRIDVLTPAAFEETTIARITPDRNSPYPDGAHTLNVANGMILLDAKRHRRHPLAPYYRWRRMQLSKRRAIVPS